MNLDKIKQDLRNAYARLKQVSDWFRSRRDKASPHSLEGVEGNLTKPQVFAYRLLGERTAGLLPLFKDMDVNLEKSGLKMSFKGYVSLTVLTTLITLGSVLVIIPTLTFFVFRLSLFLTVLYTVGTTLFACAFSVIGFYLYPIIRTSSMKRDLDDTLPFATGYLSILASAGVPPTQMFRSLAKMDPSTAVSHEAKDIVRDVELFGVDVISAIETASRRTPSEKFRDLLEGFVATINSGGDLCKYLSERSKQFMRLKRIALRRLGDTLSVLAEFYVVMLVAGPLILVVMLAVMAMLGGGTPGPINPRLLLELLTYVGLPIGSIVFIIMLDIVTPKR